MIDSKDMKIQIGELLSKNGIPFTEELTSVDCEIETFNPLIREALMNTTELRCVIDDKTLAALMSLHPTNNYTLSYTTETNIPKRKNKRKRIQKKWNKKYGFKLKTVRMDGMKMKSTTDGDVCEFEAVQEI